MPPPKGRKIAASKKKKQTRLTFDPVDQSSSPAPGPSPAKVRYAKSAPPLSKGSMPSSSLQIEEDSDSGDPITSSALSARFKPPVRKNGRLPFKKAAPLPTPVKSSQLLGGSRGGKIRKSQLITRGLPVWYANTIKQEHLKMIRKTRSQIPPSAHSQPGVLRENEVRKNRNPIYKLIAVPRTVLLRSQTPTRLQSQRISRSPNA